MLTLAWGLFLLVLLAGAGALLAALLDCDAALLPLPLLSAAALVRPTGIDGMQVSSLKKKMKDKAFAASVNRDIIRQCADMGMTLEDFLALAIEAMSGKAAELGLGKAVQQQDGRL